MCQRVEIIEVIITEFTRGKGTKEDVMRIVTQIWSLQGKLIAENDPTKENPGT